MPPLPTLPVLLALAFLASALALPLRPSPLTSPAMSDTRVTRSIDQPDFARSFDTHNAAEFAPLFLRPRAFTPAFALGVRHDAGFEGPAWRMGEVCAIGDRARLASYGEGADGEEEEKEDGTGDAAGDEGSIFEARREDDEHGEEEWVHHSHSAVHDPEDHHSASRLGSFPSRDSKDSAHRLDADSPADTRARQSESTESEPSALDATTAATLLSPDCPALLALFDSTSGPTWLNNAGWPHPSPASDIPTTTLAWPCCLAHGVSCTPALPHRVLALDLAANNLSGPLPVALFDLPHLARLNLSSNALSGTLPDAFDGLPGLRVVRLDDNSLSGTLPRTLLEALKLTAVHLADNAFSGPLAFPRAANLTVLSVARNAFSGPLALAPNPLLATVHADHNAFTGAVPTLNPALITFTAAHNNLSFFLADALALATSLTTLDLSSNPLTGTFPDAPAPPKLVSCQVDAFDTPPCPMGGNGAAVTVLGRVCGLACQPRVAQEKRAVKTSGAEGGWRHDKGAVAVAVAFATALAMSLLH